MWWLIEIMLVMVLTVGGTGAYNRQNASILQQRMRINVATNTANIWLNFADALDAYAAANPNAAAVSRGGAVTCADLQNAGNLPATFGNGTCTDPFGETLVGEISSPYGSPQNIFVVAENAPTAAALQRYGLTRAPNQTESVSAPDTFEGFAMSVAKDITTLDPMKHFGVVVQTATNANGQAMPHAGAFMIPESDSGYASGLSQYFPTTGVTWPQTVPTPAGYDGYAIMITTGSYGGGPGSCNLTLAANPCNFTYGAGQPLQVSWNAPGATSCDLSYALNGGTPADHPGLGASNQTTTYNPTGLGSLVVNAACSGPGGAACNASTTVQVGCQVGLTIPSTGGVSGTALPISWQAPGTSSCTISFDDGGASQTVNNDANGNGSTTYVPANAENLTVTATCSGNGVPCTARQSVNVACQVAVNIPTTAVAVTPFSTTWTSSDTGDVCTLTYTDDSPQPDTSSFPNLLWQGSKSFSPLWAEPLTVTATCISPRGPYCTTTTPMQITSPVTVWTDTTSPMAGQPMTISWNAPGTAACTLSINSSEPGGSTIPGLASSGSTSYTPPYAGPLTIVVTCKAPDGTPWTNQTVVTAGCDVGLTIGGLASQGVTQTISWTAPGTTVCQTSASWAGAPGSVIGTGTDSGSLSYLLENSGETLTITTQCTSPWSGTCQGQQTELVSTTPGGCPAPKTSETACLPNNLPAPAGQTQCPTRDCYVWASNYGAPDYPSSPSTTAWDGSVLDYTPVSIGWTGTIPWSYNPGYWPDNYTERHFFLGEAPAAVLIGAGDYPDSVGTASAPGPFYPLFGELSSLALGKKTRIIVYGTPSQVAGWEILDIHGPGVINNAYAPYSMNYGQGSSTRGQNIWWPALACYGGQGYWKYPEPYYSLYYDLQPPSGWGEKIADANSGIKAWVQEGLNNGTVGLDNRLWCLDPNPIFWGYVPYCRQPLSGGVVATAFKVVCDP